MPLDGWLIIDKPTGVGSTDVVTLCKRGFNAQKCGHGGTLDPLATGVLPIAFGAATKTVPYVMDGTKTYRFTLKFGEARDSDDADGKVIATSDVRPDDATIRAALPQFIGDIMQVPPRPDADTAVFFVESGKGVYMRSLARDIARACGTVGHITALRRMRVGPFHEKDAVALDKIAVSGDTPPPSPALLLPVTTALADIPALALTEAEAARLSYGQHIPLVDFMGRVPREANPDGGLARAMVGGRLMGLARLEEGLLKPERWLGQGGS